MRVMHRVRRRRRPELHGVAPPPPLPRVRHPQHHRR
ncbi:hypothetical protein EE612_009325 [Oryza sativa]|nr:hypothetical protein EE612_009325 [Oryza sativa]